MPMDWSFLAFLQRSGAFGEYFQGQQELQDIVGVRDDASRAHGETNGAVSGLKFQVAALSQALAAMKVAFEVLSNVLVDSGIVDTAALDARLAEALVRAEAERRASTPGVCSNCGLTFPGSKLEDTDAGRLCKRCRAVAG